MKLQTRLIILSAVPMAGLALAVSFILLSAQVFKQRITHIMDESVVFAEHARQMQFDVVQVQQWLSDISATRGQDGLDDGFAEAEKSRQSFLTHLKEFQSMYEREQDQEALKELQAVSSSFEAYYQAGREMAAAYVKDGPSNGNRLMARFDAAAEDLHDALDPLVEEQTSEFGTSLAQMQALVIQTGRWSMGIAILLFLATAGLTIHSSRSISRSVTEVSQTMKSGAEQTTSAAAQLSATSQMLASGSSEQAASLEETSASLEEISSMTQRNSQNAGSATALAAEARAAADAGTSDMREMTEAMADIQKSSGNIANILKTIDEIAFQTNLLALNAAVEAARAGEAGMGFAVVANEVRNLAQRSAQAAHETAEKIGDSVSKSDRGMALCKRVASGLQQIVERARKVDELVAEIAAASKEQHQGISQLNGAISQMDRITQGNAATAQESASAAEELYAQAATMSQSVQGLLRLIGEKTGETDTNYLPKASGVERRQADRSPGRNRIPPSLPSRETTRSGPVEARGARPLNCWEFKKCGREAGGAKAKELGVCPAYPDHGRQCAQVAGTLCGGKVQGSFAHKLTSCMNCKFFNGPNYDRSDLDLQKRGAAPASRLHGPKTDPLPMPAKDLNAPLRTAAPPNGEVLIQWEPARMATGIESIDAQHQELIALINELHEAYRLGTTREKVKPMIAFLSRYVRDHFSHEEGLMNEHKCPSRSANLQAHREFLRKFEDLTKALESNLASAALLDMKNLLGRWLESHICGIDTQLRNCSRSCNKLKARMKSAAV